MNISNKYAVMIFKKTFNDKPTYSMGLSKKKQDGTYENGFIKCEFKKDVELEDKTKIYLTSAFLTFYKDKDNKTIPYIKILEFNSVEEIKQVKEEVKDPFKEFSYDLTDDDLPF